MRKSSRLAFSLASIVLLFGCGGPEVEEATGDRSAATANQDEEVNDEEIQSYFDALASNDADEMEKVAGLAAPDSIAQAYAMHQANIVNAAQDMGMPYESEDVRSVEGGYETCGTDEEGKEVCYTYADLESTAGKLSSFTVNGKSLKDRISLGNGQTAKAGRFGRVEFLSAYKSADNDLWVAVKFKTSKGEPAIFAGYEAKYRSPDGRQSTAGELIGSEELDPNSMSFEVMIFPRAKAGGTVSIPVYDLDYYGEVNVKIKTR
jgi:hypothetical protein